MNLFLFCIVVPLYLAGLCSPQKLGWVLSAVDVVQAIIVLLLCAGGLYTGLRLSRSLRGNDKAKVVVRTVDLSIGIGIFGALAAVSGVVYQTVFVAPTIGEHFTLSKAYLEFFLVHHIGEFLIVFSLFETKRRQYFAKGGKLFEKAVKVVGSGMKSRAKSLSKLSTLSTAHFTTTASSIEKTEVQSSRDSDVESVSNPMGEASQHDDSGGERSKTTGGNSKFFAAGTKSRGSEDVAL